MFRPKSSAKTPRKPSPAGRAPPGGPEERTPSTGRVSLRLAVTRGGLGIELVDPFDWEALSVEELLVSLVGLSFPVDLSGGVPQFRHRRGLLERLVVSARHDRTTARLSPRLRGVLGPGKPLLTLAPMTGGVLVGLSEDDRALAFEALWAPREGDARWVVGGARGIHLGAPPLAVALRALDTLTGKSAVREGALVTFPLAATLVMRELMPEAGARVPDTREARWGALEADAAGWRASCDRALSPVLLGEHVVRELELASLARTADDALTAGDLDTARAGYLALLERAPRHPELAMRLAEIDRAVPERLEAALATVAETMPVLDAGVLGAELLAAIGDPTAAKIALGRAAANEPYGPLAALTLLSAANIESGARSRAELLDQAVARAPALSAPRWARLTMRLELSDWKGAMADAEHLEAAASGAERRHEVWRRAAALFLEHGQQARAVTLHERALRYAPESPRAVAGLAESLLAAGRPGRALDLLARAVELSERRNEEAHDVVLTLARALADTARDLPAAIARLRSIPAGQPETLDARGLEARYRAALGDLAGASLAFARMRDWIEVAEKPEPEKSARWLEEAARFERTVKDDRAAAQRHLALALRLAPRNESVAAAFRAAHAAPVPARRPPASAAATGNLDWARPAVETGADLGWVADDLSQKLRANPADHTTALRLAGALEALGKDMELYAMVSARLEEPSPPEVRRELAKHKRDVLLRLAARARTEGRADEANLYEHARANDDADDGAYE